MLSKYFKKYFLFVLLIVLTLFVFAYQNLGLKDYLTYSKEGAYFISKLVDFTTLFISIIVEALPFVILGVLVSVLVALFVKESFILRILPKNRILSHIIVSLLGIFMPVCECGNIPVARRLISKGFSVSHSITFLLAAPILNPITFLSTWEAFSYDKSIAVIRIVSAFFIANIIGIILSFKRNQQELLNEKFVHENCEIEHDHKISLKSALHIFESEFSEVIKLLCFGAFIAALSQSFIPREVILQLGQNPILSVLVMIALAFIISICSNVDAFFALSYSNTFTSGSILSFLIFGPMIDIKILSMMKSTYKTKLLVIVTSLVFLFSLLIGLLVNYIS